MNLENKIKYTSAAGRPSMMVGALGDFFFFLPPFFAG